MKDETCGFARQCDDDCENCKENVEKKCLQCGEKFSPHGGVHEEFCKAECYQYFFHTDELE